MGGLPGIVLIAVVIGIVVGIVVGVVWLLKGPVKRYRKYRRIRGPKRKMTALGVHVGRDPARREIAEQQVTLAGTLKRLNSQGEKMVSSLGPPARLYVELRLGRIRAQQRIELVSLERQVTHLQGKLTKAAASQVPDIQAQLNRARADVRSLKTALDEPSQQVSVATAEEEFRRILNMPGVVHVRMANGGLIFTISGTYEYLGTLYDLGDWEVELNPSNRKVQTYLARSAVRIGWQRTQHPSYQYPDGRFCFASRADEIKSHFRSGQYLQVMALVTEAINTINPSNRVYLSRAFKYAKRRPGAKT